MQDVSEAAGARHECAGEVQQDPRVWVTFYRDETHPKPTHAEAMPWRSLVRKLTTHDIRKSKSGPAFSPVQLHEGTTRANKNVEAVSAVVLDFDGGREINDVAARLDQRGIEHVLFTTHSHCADHHKFRVIVPLSRPVTPEEWLNVWRGAVELIGGGVDEACSDASRLYYLPSCPPSRFDDARAGHREGRWLDPDELVALDPQHNVVTLPVSSTRTKAINDEATPDYGPMADTPENIARVRSALATLDPAVGYVDVRTEARVDEHGVEHKEKWDWGWRNTIFATLASGLSGAVDAAREWSMRAPERWNEAVFDKLVESFDPGGKTKVNTLFKLAQKAGWVDPATVLVDVDDDDAQAPGPTANDTADAPGDLVNAEIFARHVAEQLRYVHAARKWLIWYGMRWLWAERGEELEAAKHVARRIFRSATEKAAQLGTDTPAGRRWVTHAMRTLREGAIEAMMKLARSDARLAIGSVAELDAEPDLLGVRDGVVDLRTGELLSADPDRLMTRQAAASVVQGATCPTWLRFLSDVFQGDREMIDFIQRAVGYTLTGSVTEEVLFFMHGYGNNGKSVFANTITAVLGDYALTAPASMLTARRDASGPRDDVARLAGARLVNANETQAGERLDDQLVKSLVSRERVAARFLYGSYFEFQPTGKIWMRGNHKPIVVGDDLGIWRRILLVPFERTFSADEIDCELEMKLLAERDGILQWAIEGAAKWYRAGLRPPAAVTRASAAYRRESDVLGQFLDDECERSAEAEVGQRVLYTRYVGWCRDNGFRAMSKAQMTRRLTERGIAEGRSSAAGRERTYRGVRLGR